METVTIIVAVPSVTVIAVLIIIIVIIVLAIFAGYKKNRNTISISKHQNKSADQVDAHVQLKAANAIPSNETEMELTIKTDLADAD